MTRRQTAFFETSARALYAERATYFRRIEVIASDGSRLDEVDGYLQLIENINRSLIEISGRFNGPAGVRM